MTACSPFAPSASTASAQAPPRRFWTIAKSDSMVSDASEMRLAPNPILILGISSIWRKIHFPGEVPERSNGPVSKTGVRATVPRVRIPPSPLCKSVQPDAKQCEKPRFPRGFLRFLVPRCSSCFRPFRCNPAQPRTSAARDGRRHFRPLRHHWERHSPVVGRHAVFGRETFIVKRCSRRFQVIVSGRRSRGIETM